MSNKIHKVTCVYYPVTTAREKLYCRPHAPAPPPSVSYKRPVTSGSSPEPTKRSRRASKKNRIPDTEREENGSQQ